MAETAHEREQGREITASLERQHEHHRDWERRHNVPFPARTERPAGQPGTVTSSHLRREPWSTTYHWSPGLSYPAVRLQSGIVVFWRDSEDDAAHWIVAPARLAESFVAGPEWQADCDHVHALPWMVCAFEADCLALRREEARDRR